MRSVHSSCWFQMDSSGGQTGDDQNVSFRPFRSSSHLEFEMACKVHSTILERFGLGFKTIDWQRCHLLNNLLCFSQFANFTVVFDLTTKLWQSKNDKFFIDFCHHRSVTDFMINRYMSLLNDQSGNV